jgi:hypothetical protein
MPGKGWIPWSAWEQRLLDRCARGVEERRFESVAEAARAFLKALERSRVGPPPGVRTRNYLSVHGCIRRRLGAKRFGALHSAWKPEERAVLDRYVAALLTRRYETVQEAAEACFAEFERLRRTGKRRTWAPTPRNVVAVRSRLFALSHAAGRRAHQLKWSPVEWKAVERFARALARGRYPDKETASAECCRELRRLPLAFAPRAPKPPVRSLQAVRERVSRRAHKLGWSWTTTLWLPQERRIIERYVRGISSGSLPWVEQAARDCCRELRGVRDRLRIEDPQALRRVVRRTYATVLTYLSRWSLERGRPVRRFWTERNLRVTAAYAHALVEGRPRSALEAARACHRDIKRLCRRTGQAGQNQGKFQNVPRFGVVYNMLLQQAHRLARPWPASHWTTDEDKVCLQWVRWYDRHRGARRLAPLKTAVTGLHEDLEKTGSSRSRVACQLHLAKLHRHLHGVA